jgi:hypothetical protein
MQARIEDMTPLLKKLYDLFDAKMKQEGVPYALNAVLRTRGMQAAYAAQGRTISEFMAMLTKFGWTLTLAKVTALSKAGKTARQICDQLRSDAGMSVLPDSDWPDVVTKTLHSRHFAGPDGKSSAFDIVILKNGKTPTWDIKFDADSDSIPEYLEAARIGKSVGLVPGAFWTDFHDWPHFEVPGNTDK